MDFLLLAKRLRSKPRTITWSGRPACSGRIWAQKKTRSGFTGRGEWSGDEGERNEDGGNDGEHLHNVVGALRLTGVKSSHQLSRGLSQSVERVDKLKSHFAMTEKDLRDVDISADRITKRGQRILDVDLGVEPTALPKPK